MEIKQLKAGDPITRTEDGRFVGYAAADGIQITAEPHEIAAFKRCLFVTDMQLVQSMSVKRLTCPIQIQIGNPK